MNRWIGICGHQVNGLSLWFWHLFTNQWLSICGIWLWWAREEWEQMTQQTPGAPACLWEGDGIWCRNMPIPGGWTMAPWWWATGTQYFMASEVFCPFSGLLGFKTMLTYCLSSERSSFRYLFIAKCLHGLAPYLSLTPGTLSAVQSPLGTSCSGNVNKSG